MSEPWVDALREHWTAPQPDAVDFQQRLDARLQRRGWSWWRVPVLLAAIVVVVVAWPEPLLPVVHGHGHAVFDGALGARVIGDDGVELRFPRGSVRDAAGQVAGAVEVDWRLVNAVEALRQADVHLQSLDGPLQSFGMVEVELASRGQEVKLDGVATLSFPLARGHGFTEGEAIGLYHLEDTDARWVREGHGVHRGGRFEAEVGHFSWWNADEPIAATGCVRGDWSAGPTTFELFGADVLIKSQAKSEQGGFCLDGLADTDVVLGAMPETGCWQPASLVARSTLSSPGTSCRLDASVCTELTWVPLPCEEDDGDDGDDGDDDAVPTALEEELAQRAHIVEAAPVMTAQIEDDGDVVLVEEAKLQRSLMRTSILLQMIGTRGVEDERGGVVGGRVSMSTPDKSRYGKALDELSQLSAEQRWREVVDHADSLLLVAEDAGWRKTQTDSVERFRLAALNNLWVVGGDDEDRIALHSYAIALLARDGETSELGEAARAACRDSGPVTDCVVSDDER